MAAPGEQTELLVELAARGDAAAVRQLLTRFRGRVRQMVSVRLDDRVSARVDPSDVVQDALIEAHRRLPQYLVSRPMPFYPWLRQIAWEKLVAHHRRHPGAKKRTCRAEEPPQLSAASAMRLAERLEAAQTSPSQEAVGEEMRQRVRQALDRLDSRRREVLVLRFLERPSVKEVAAVLRISTGAVEMRQVRALERLRDLLDDVRETPSREPTTTRSCPHERHRRHVRPARRANRRRMPGRSARRS